MSSGNEETPEQDVTHEEEENSRGGLPTQSINFLDHLHICIFSRTPHYWPHRPKMDKPKPEQMCTIILVYLVNSTIFKICKLGHG